MELEQIEKIIFEQPNYKKEKLNNVELAEFLCYEGQVRHFCPLCNDISVFSMKKSFGDSFEDLAEMFEELTGKIFARKTLTCAHNQSHSLYFFYIIQKESIIKVGQYPAYEELRKIEEIEEYRSIIGKEAFAELTTAIGLFHAGLAIPAFTYLRRIIEKMIYTARENAKIEGIISLETFDEVDFDGKIKLLSSFLPKALIEKKQLYKVLSIGIHKLDKDLCFEIFPIVLKNVLDIFKEQGNQKIYENTLHETKNELVRIATYMKEGV